jgi:hypothetical protein
MHIGLRSGVVVSALLMLVGCSGADTGADTRTVSSTAGRAGSTGPAGSVAVAGTMAGSAGVGSGVAGSNAPVRPITAIAVLMAFPPGSQAGAGGAGGMLGAAGHAGAAGGSGTAAIGGSGGMSGRGGAGGRGGAAGRGGAGGRTGASGRGGAGGAGGISAGSGAAGAGGASGEGGAVGAAGAGGAGAGGAGAGGAGGAAGAGGKAADVMGSAVFTQSATGVSLGVALSNCSDGKHYPIHIHMGMSCMDPSAPGGHWDPPRGEGIPDLVCNGSTASEMYPRLNTDAKPWSIGAPMASDIVGHTVVIHDPDDTTKRIACGKIAAQ